MTRIIATSDLHGNLPETPTTADDILVIAGDVCPDFSHDTARDRQLEWLDEQFRFWLSAQGAKYIVGVAGNHDFVFEHRKDDVDALHLPWHYLLDSSVELQGVKFWGLPWVPNLRRWAFYGSNLHLQMAYELVPDDTDIVISHGPPYGVCDMVGTQPVGARAANEMIKRVQPLALVCGHIHEGFGEIEYGGSSVCNVSYVDEYYEPQHRWGVIDT